MNIGAKIQFLKTFIYSSNFVDGFTWNATVWRDSHQKDGARPKKRNKAQVRQNSSFHTDALKTEKQSKTVQF